MKPKINQRGKKVKPVFRVPRTTRRSTPTTTTTITTLQLLVVLLCCYSPVKLVLSRPSSSSSSTSNRHVPNKYVQSSPPCIAAVCKNGIALVALHANIQTEPLIRNENDSSSTIFPDLPLVSRNPLRIERLDDRGSVLVTCGWRADGMILADVGRELCRDELMRYGHGYGRGNYGTWLGWGLVKYLVKCEARDSIRSLSTMGLLASCSGGNSNNDNTNSGSSGELYLIDTTGIIQCRAYAIGKHSTQLNERLVGEQFAHLTVEEGAQLLLDIIQECSVAGSSSTSTTNKSNNDGRDKGLDDVDEGNYDDWDMPSGTCVEIVVVDSTLGKVRRLRQPILSQKITTLP